jgi:hydrogenase maturation protein HypF
MLYGILPDDEVLSLLASRGWPDMDLGVLKKQVATGFNVPVTTSTGRVLDAASALLGCCRERTYDGEPAMKLESAAAGMEPEPWELSFSTLNGCEVLSTRALIQTAFAKLREPGADDLRRVRSIAASFQHNLARGIAAMAARAAEREGLKNIALSGGVAYNHAIRETIRQEVVARGHTCIINADYPLGDGCVSYGQCVYAGSLLNTRR